MPEAYRKTLIRQISQHAHNAVLASEDGRLPLALSADGVHPNVPAYARMTSALERALVGVGPSAGTH